MEQVKEEANERRVNSKPMVLFKPGEGGRQKGSKNRITLVKADLEITLRDFSKKYVPHVLAKALEMALGGDRSMIKLILDLHMSKPQHHESEDTNKGAVQILVQNLTTRGGETSSVIKTGTDLTVGVPKALTPAVIIEATVLPSNKDGIISENKDEQAGQSRIDGNSEEYSEVDSSGSETGSDHGKQ